MDQNHIDEVLRQLEERNRVLSAQIEALKGQRRQILATIVNDMCAAEESRWKDRIAQLQGEARVIGELFASEHLLAMRKTLEEWKDRQLKNLDAPFWDTPAESR